MKSLLNPHWGMTREQLTLLGALGVLLLFVGLMNLASQGVDAGKISRLFRSWIRRLLRRIGWHRTAGVEIGCMFLPDEARLRHTHIVGATGSGKTVLLECLIEEDIRRGMGVLVIDAKGDRELYDHVAAVAAEVGRKDDLALLSATHLEESSVWNPCGLGNASELQTKFYNSCTYAEPHYAKHVERGLISAFSRLTVRFEAEAFTLRNLVQSLKTEFQGKSLEGLEGLFLDLENMTKSEWAPVLGCDQKAGVVEEISLFEIIQKGRILFVDLPTEAKAVQSARIGRLLLQEIILISGLRKLDPTLRSGRPFSVFVDEFDAFATESFAMFLNKGRSSDFMIHIAHQTLSDLNRVGQDFAGRILGNANVRFIFRQDDPDDAETWSRFLGTSDTIKQTWQSSGGASTGQMSNRLAKEFRIEPDAIKELRVGECIFSMKSPRELQRFRVPFRGRKRATLSSESRMEVVSRMLVEGASRSDHSQQELAAEQAQAFFDTHG